MKKKMHKNIVQLTIVYVFFVNTGLADKPNSNAGGYCLNEYKQL